MDASVIKLQGDVYLRWCNVGKERGLSSDGEIARCLLDQYEICQTRVKAAACCHRCQAPLVCTKCPTPAEQRLLPEAKVHPTTPVDFLNDTIFPDNSTTEDSNVLFCSQTKNIAGEGLETVLWNDTNTSNAPCSILSDRQHAARDVANITDQDKTYLQNAEISCTCTQCGVSFDDGDSLVQHERSHSDQKLLVCCRCNKTFTADADLQRHLQEGACLVTETLQSGLDAGQVLTHLCMQPPVLQMTARTKGLTENRVTCKECGKSYCNTTSLNLHMRIHRGERRFECDICGHKFRSSSHLSVHRRCKHTHDKPYKCCECDAAFPRKEALTVHMAKHTGLYPLVCPDCGHGFHHRGDLRKHVRTHSGEKPYKCDDCEARFRVLADLHKHWQVNHSGQRPYKCSACSAVYSNKAALEAHRKNHENLRGPHKCASCNFGFSQLGHLEVHLQKNPDHDKIVCVCDSCDKSFMDMSTLAVHKQTKHTTSKRKRAVRSNKQKKRSSVQKDKQDFLKAASDETISLDGGTPMASENLVHRSHMNSPIQNVKTENSDNHEDTFQNIDISNNGSELDINTHFQNNSQSHQQAVDKPFKCSQCDAAFLRRHNLSLHVTNKHTGVYPYQCTDCSMDFRWPGRLKLHWQVRHSGQEMFHCSDCDTVFALEEALNDHRKRKHEPKGSVEDVVCHICGAMFGKSFDLKAHLRRHSDVRAFSCKYCHTTFKHPCHKHEKLCLKKLMGESTKKEKLFVCAICGSRFATKYYLDYHTKLHNREIVYRCDLCDAELTSPKGLTIHRRTHTGEKPYSCDQCGKSFSSLSGLRNHQVSHSDAKPFQCSQCGVSFARKYQVKQHMVIHTRERKYVCSVCSSTFPRAGSLSVHMRLKHTGDKPYACKDCGSTFALSRDLKKHKEREHANIT